MYYSQDDESWITVDQVNPHISSEEKDNILPPCLGQCILQVKLLYIMM